ncbi:MAG: type II toxin-antitoxin system prevent-host-death family antitoxin [Chitinophagaceae bacterium]|nr:type II toxin-antitoxin system prevent-host-death family antitoxin [Polaromonas sp.]
MRTVGLFEAKTHLNEYVARAKAVEEVIIMRYNKPVVKIVPLKVKSAPQKTPEFVQRVFHSGGFLADLAKANELLAELDNAEYLSKVKRGV